MCVCLFFLALFFFLERKNLHILHRPWGSTCSYITNQVHEAREVHENVYCDRKVSLTRSTTILSMFNYLFNIALRNPSLFRAFVHKWHDRIFWTKLTAFRSFFFFFGVEVVSHSCWRHAGRARCLSRRVETTPASGLLKQPQIDIT